MFSQKRKRELFEKEALPHLDALYGMAVRLTRNPRDAEDLVQDALVKAYRFFEQYESGSNFKAWLFKVLTTVFYNNHRQAKQIQRLTYEAEKDFNQHQFISAASSAGKYAEANLLSDISSDKLRQAVEKLPEEFRLTVLLCDVYDFSYKEIAEILDCPVGTVMSRLHRGRKILQSELLEYAVESGIVPATDLETYRRRKGGQ